MQFRPLLSHVVQQVLGRATDAVAKQASKNKAKRYFMLLYSSSAALPERDR